MEFVIDIESCILNAARGKRKRQMASKYHYSSADKCTTRAYYEMTFIIVVESFIVHAAGRKRKRQKAAKYHCSIAPK